MQVNQHKNTIDQHLSSSLKEDGTNGSVFKWYLAMQINDVFAYHPEKHDESEGFLPYPSINLPSAPKPNFYAQDNDYKEFYKQQDGLSKCKHTTVNIKFMNCLKPQSLHYSKYERLIAPEIIENSPWHIQYELGKKSFHKHNSNEDFGISQSGISKAEVTTSKMPTNFFVDATLENTAMAVEITF